MWFSTSQSPGKLAAAVPEDTTVIEPKSGWQLIDFRELWEYRDLFYFLVWRDIKVRYAQSILGFGWAVIRPVISMIIFTIVFGKNPIQLFEVMPVATCHVPTKGAELGLQIA